MLLRETRQQLSMRPAARTEDQGVQTEEESRTARKDSMDTTTEIVKVSSSRPESGMSTEVQEALRERQRQRIYEKLFAYKRSNVSSPMVDGGKASDEVSYR